MGDRTSVLGENVPRRTSSSGLRRACVSFQQRLRDVKEMADILHLSTPILAPILAPSDSRLWSFGARHAENGIRFQPRFLFSKLGSPPPTQCYFSLCVLSKCHPPAGNIITSSCWALFSLDFWTYFLNTVSNGGLSLSGAST